MQQKREEFQKVWAKIMAKAWSDRAFKESLLKDPHAVLESHGIAIPTGIRVVISENTATTFYLTLPQKPEGELTDEKLQSIAAGVANNSFAAPC